MTDATETVTVTATAHTHESDDNTITTVTAHTGAGTTMDITVPAHAHEEGEHTADTAVIFVTGHTHQTGGAVTFGVIAHSHAVADTVDAHTHDAPPAHKHSDDGITVVEITEHTHASNRRVVVVRAHEHDGVIPTHSLTGVDQTKPHLHAVGHNGKYGIHVHSVVSGAGTVTLRQQRPAKAGEKRGRSRRI